MHNHSDLENRSLQTPRWISAFNDWSQYDPFTSDISSSSWGLTPGHFLAVGALITTCLWIAPSLFPSQSSLPKAPLVGWNIFYEPRFVANLRFLWRPMAILDEGYRKFAAEPFWFARNDADMIVLPNRHVEEIRRLHPTIANPTEAHTHNLIGHVTQMDLILKSNLHFRVIQSRLTPSLGLLASLLQGELAFAMANHFPACNDWTTTHPYHAILGLVARTSARAFVGLPHCRSEQWLRISTQFTENSASHASDKLQLHRADLSVVFISLLVLRTFPPWAHRTVSMFLPTIWMNHFCIKQAQKILVPDIKRMQRKLEQGEPSDDTTVLAWMVQSATEFDRDPNHLAHLTLIISLASIHTTQMNAVHCLNDLAAHPEFVEPLREEIREAARDGWRKSSFSKLRKLDSFMKESQRFNPPSLLSYHRVMKQSYTLSDGTHLPQGAHICMPVHHIQNDREVTPRPEVFDPFRYERLRQNPGEAHLHQFATTTPETLNFGHGKYACPGRFFAALEIKSILVRLIMNYDFKLPDGQGRPENSGVYEFIFPNRDSELLFKQRPVEEQIDFGAS